MRTQICIAIAFHFACAIANAQQQMSRLAIDAIEDARKPLEAIDDRYYKCDSTRRTTSLEQGKLITVSTKFFTKINGQNKTYGSYVTSQNPKSVDTHSFNGAISLNSRYLFKAERSKLSESWLLVKFAPNDDALRTNEMELLRLLNIADQRAFATLFSIPLKVGDTKAEGLSNLPNFSLESFVESADRRRFTIIFRCAGATKGVADSTVSTCRVVYDLDQFGIPVEFSEKNVKDNVTRELTFNVVFQKLDEKIFSKSITRKLTYRTGETLTYSEESEMNPVFTLGKLP